MNATFIVASLLAFVVGLPAIAVAQDAPDPADAAERRLGPLRFTPVLSLDFGYDTNVFNVSTERSRDVSLELTPHIDSWLRLGRARLSGVTTVDLVYFREFASERSVNATQHVTLALPLNRIRPYVSVRALSTRERLNFEIDDRARHIERLASAGVDVRITPKTTLAVVGTQSRVKFSTDSESLDVEYRELLNRRWRSLTGSLRRAITPYTTLVMLAEAQQERFDFSPLRDSDSTRFMPGVEFNKSALIAGRASVGYRRFIPRTQLIPRFSGVVASADLGYTLGGVTRFSVLTDRDVAYSIDPARPYYRLQSWSGSLQHQANASWIVGATVGHHRLAYQLMTANPLLQEPSGSVDPGNVGLLPGQRREESIRRFGGNIGYRFGPDALLTVSVDQYSRLSQITSREYEGLRVTTNITMRD